MVFKSPYAQAADSRQAGSSSLTSHTNIYVALCTRYVVACGIWCIVIVYIYKCTAEHPAHRKHQYHFPLRCTFIMILRLWFPYSLACNIFNAVMCAIRFEEYTAAVQTLTSSGRCFDGNSKFNKLATACIRKQWNHCDVKTIEQFCFQWAMAILSGVLFSICAINACEILQSWNEFRLPFRLFIYFCVCRTR